MGSRLLVVNRAMTCSAVAGGLALALCLGNAAALAQAAGPMPAIEGLDATPIAPPAPQPAAPPKPVIAAKTLFGAVKKPARLPKQAIGDYAKGCVAGATALPVTGRSWQAMRLKRNRNWGHPALIDWLQRYAGEAKTQDGWPGMLVGDMSQPRGGPMLTGHASHQLGLDADIWFLAMPQRVLTADEREHTSAVALVTADKLSVDPKTWSDGHGRIIKRAAQSPQLERVFVHPAIKKELCQKASSEPAERAWLAKVRPSWGHDDHFHVRIACPKDSPGCRPQKPVPADDGCGKELDDWYKLLTAPPAPPPPPGQPVKPPPPPMTLEAMPLECRAVLNAP